MGNERPPQLPSHINTDFICMIGIVVLHHLPNIDLLDNQKNAIDCSRLECLLGSIAKETIRIVDCPLADPEDFIDDGAHISRTSGSPLWSEPRVLGKAE